MQYMKKKSPLSSWSAKNTSMLEMLWSETLDSNMKTKCFFSSCCEYRHTHAIPLSDLLCCLVLLHVYIRPAGPQEAVGGTGSVPAHPEVTSCFQVQKESFWTIEAASTNTADRHAWPLGLQSILEGRTCTCMGTVVHQLRRSDFELDGEIESWWF